MTALHGLPEGTVETTNSEWRAKTHPDDVARVEGMPATSVPGGAGANRQRVSHCAVLAARFAGSSRAVS